MSYSAQDQVGECADQQWRIVERRHHVEVTDTERFGVFARFDIDFVQRLDVLGKKRNGNHQHALDAVAREIFDRGGGEGCSHFCGPTLL